MMSADAIREVLHALLDDPRFSDHLAWDSRVVFFLLYFLNAQPRSYAFLERFQALLRGSRFEATVFDIVRERVSRLMFDAKNRS